MRNRTIVFPKRASEITQEIAINDTYAMQLGDRVVNATLAAAKTVTLPPVKDAAGHIYTIFGTATADPNILTISQNSADIITENILAGMSGMYPSISLDANGEYVVLYSDGCHWHPIAENISHL